MKQRLAKFGLASIIVNLFSGVFASPASILSPDFQVHIIGADEQGNPTVRQWDHLAAKNDVVQNDIFIPPQLKISGNLDYANYQHDTLWAPRNISQEPRSVSTQSAGPAIVEIVIVVDKEFGDLFGMDYWRVVDYLTIYFWDVNLRFKTLLTADVTFRVNGLLIMESPAAQPFIENARAADGRTNHNRILNLYRNWIYEQRYWLVRHDLAPLLTASRGEWGGGLAWGGGTCGVDNSLRIDWGTCVWNDGGDFGSVTVGAHEMAHTIGAPHDDDPNANCPKDYGFIMSGGNDDYRYFFSQCSDRHISAFSNSASGSCLHRIDGYPTAPFDPNLSSPKAPSMQELCRQMLKNPAAWIDQADTFNCKTMFCKRRDDSNPNVIWTHYRAPVENTICGNGGGRCFRGKCRSSKLLKNVGDGNCLSTPERFGQTVSAAMGPCPQPSDATPLNSVEVFDGPGDKRISTPFSTNDNKEYGDRCLYTGTGDGGYIWTDRCSNDNPWHGWEFRTAAGGFMLVHKVTGRCAESSGGDVRTWSSCNAGNRNMLWTLVDAN